MRNLDRPAWSGGPRGSLSALLLAAALLTAVTPATVADDNAGTLRLEAPADDAPQRVLSIPGGPPSRIIQRLFGDNPGCSHAKLDVWFERGRHTYTLFMTEDGSAQHADMRSDSDGTTILLGSEGCRHRIRIERAE
jgi:hypothetical protein